MKTAKKAPSASRRYAADLRTAKAIFKAKTGRDYDLANLPPSGTKIFKAKKPGARRYFIGTYLDWLNK